MKWNIEKSDELKETIAKDGELMGKLSNAVDNVLKNHGIKLGDMSYVFEPRVFTMSPDEAPEVIRKSREAMLVAIIGDLYKKRVAEDSSIIAAARVPLHCIPYCGGIDPRTLSVLEDFRVKEDLDDPVPIIRTSESFIKQIVGNTELLNEFSNSVFEILEGRGIKFEENEGCVFTPVVFETPIFAQKVAVAEQSQQIRGFGPQIYADPTPEPAIMVRPFPGIIEAPWGPTPGVIIDRWWWIGIPAPEMLRALDVMRGVKGEYMKR